MKYYFLLQFTLLKREIRAYGLNPFAGLVFYVLAFIAISEMLFKKIVHANWVYAGLAIICIYMFGDETRNQSLKTMFKKNSYCKIRMLENLFCAIPFLIVLLIKNQFLPAVFVLIGAVVLSFYNSVNRPRLKIPSPFYKYPYEFTVGFRNNFLFILGAFTLIIISIFYHNLNLGLFGLISIFLICLNFYSHLDPVYFVWVHSQSPGRFIKMKIRIGVLYGFALSLTAAILLSVFYSSDMLKIALIELLGLLYVATGILSVYVNYPMPMTVSHRFQFVLGMVFFPLLLFVIPNFYMQATNRLKAFLK